MAFASPPTDLLLPPPGRQSVPDFDGGWLLDLGRPEPFLPYVAADATANWSDDLEELHEESSRSHFIDVWTRRAILERIGSVQAGSTIVDLGCSTGYLLEDLNRAHPQAGLIGIDLIAAGLRKSHALVPSARLLHADACELPIADGCVGAVVSANLLEHVPDDRRVLREVARVLEPGSRGVFVVPANPATYDYYDRYLGHERRYARGELAGKASEAGLAVVEDCYLGSLIYFPFWLVKQRNRRRYATLSGDEARQRVSEDMTSTHDAAAGRIACGLERRLLDAGVRLPFGIRNLVVVAKC